MRKLRGIAQYLEKNPSARFMILLAMGAIGLGILMSLPPRISGLILVIGGLASIVRIVLKRYIMLPSLPKLLKGIPKGIKWLLLKPKPAIAAENPNAPKQQARIPRQFYVAGGVSLILIGLIMALMLLAGEWEMALALLALTVLMLAAAISQARPDLPKRLVQAVKGTAKEMTSQDTPAIASKRAYRMGRPILFAVEILIVVLVALQVTTKFRESGPDEKYFGYEAEHLTSFVYQSAIHLREEGYISLWQPYFNKGEPLIENPFAFIFNPFSSAPSLIWGGIQGIKISIILYVVFAGVGGWFLGRTLELGPVGRVLLGLLIIGKGNMHANIGTGYFQLGVSQAFMAWVVAGVIATVRMPERRWPPVLTAVMYTLLFWAGNLWYTLPMAMSAGLLALFHLFFFEGKKFDAVGAKRLAWAGVLTIALSAVVLFPLWARRDLVDHPSASEVRREVSLEGVIKTYYEGATLPYFDRESIGASQFYYSYVAPLSFFMLVFVFIPPLFPFLGHSRLRQAWRVWIPGIIMIILCTLWATGDSAIWEWLYGKIDLLNEWRFEGRALAVSAFWLGVLIAMRVDAIVQSISHPVWWKLPFRNYLIQAGQLALVGLLAWTSWQTVREVNRHWNRFGSVVKMQTQDEVCVEWLRERHPDEPLTVYRFGYDILFPYIDHKVRESTIEISYHAFPFEPYTVSDELYLINTWPRYAVAWDQPSRQLLLEVGYHILPESPGPVDGNPCAYERHDYYFYAFTAPLSVIETMQGEGKPNHTRRVENIERHTDRITLRGIQADVYEPLVVAVEELAYPGWRVEIDGKPAKLESIGGLIGVILPPGNGTHTIYFEYHPTLVYRSGYLTLFTCLFCIFYLARVDRLILRLYRRVAPKNSAEPNDGP